MPAAIPLIVAATQTTALQHRPPGPAMFTGIMLIVVVFWGICLFKLNDLEAERKITEEQHDNWIWALNIALGGIAFLTLCFCLTI